MSGRETFYNEGDEEEAADRTPKIKHAEAFLNFCGCATRLIDTSDNEWRNLTLTSFPRHYVFDDDNGVWTKRQRTHSAVLARMHAVHPNRGDLFYCRMLLSHLVGQEVRDLVLAAPEHRHGLHVLKGTHDSFKDACRARGLIADDKEWHWALSDASRTAFPQQLRELFLHIICNCQPDRPFELFESFWKPMSDDFRKELTECINSRESPLYIQALAVSDANVRAMVLGSLRDCFDVEADAQKLTLLPELSDDDKALLSRLGRHRDMTLPHVYDYDTDHQNELYDGLYACCLQVDMQKRLVDHVMTKASQNEQVLLFLDAPGGCGKTHCFNCLLAYCRSKGKRALAVATTGIAALQLAGGKTVHSGLKVPIDVTGSRRGNVPLNITRNSSMGRLICGDLAFLFWDEVAMAHIDIFESVDHTFRQLRRDDRPFGGVSVILGGDFRQTGPVVRNGSRAQQCMASIRHSAVFQSFDHWSLLENIRVRNCDALDEAHAARLREWPTTLLGIGNGNNFVSPDDGDDFASQKPQLVNCSAIETLADVDAMIDNTFGDLNDLSGLDLDELAGNPAMHTAILCPLHTSVDYINARCLDKWRGDVVSKVSVDAYADDNDALVVTLEQINARTPNGSPPHRLNLKKGMGLILLRNMSAGMMNGTRLMLLDARPNVLVCKVMNGSATGTTVYLPRFVFTHEGPDQPLKWTRRQFPVKPCWAMTINKSQAQTLQAAAVCLVQVTDDDGGIVAVDPAEVFSHGQLYVALSRCGDPDRVRVYVTAERMRSNTVWNVVYSELLSASSALPGDAPAERGESMDQDDPRAHMDPSSAFDNVPYHGVLFDELDGWDGFESVEEAAINRNAAQAEELLESWYA